MLIKGERLFSFDSFFLGIYYCSISKILMQEKNVTLADTGHSISQSLPKRKKGKDDPGFRYALSSVSI